MKLIQHVIIVCVVSIIGAQRGLAAGPETANARDGELAAAAQETAGLCIVVGADRDVLEQLVDRRGLLIHCISRDADQVEQLRAHFRETDGPATLLVEHWTADGLPHADNLANLLVVVESDWVPDDETRRVLCPGGISVTLGDGKPSRYIKPVPEDTDTWTHQWHSADGGLITEDKTIGVPQGVQWLSGPLFAMAGRKSSTQSLVSSGGVNFYLTQNVLDNVGQAEMRQYLVARDAYNGLMLWQRDWTGPFVTGDGETNARMVAADETLYAAGAKTLLAINARTGETRADTPLSAPAEMLLYQDGVLLVQNSDGLSAFDSTLRQARWTFPRKKIAALAVQDGHVFCLVKGRSSDGQFQHTLVCRDLNTGDEEWQVNTQPHVLSASVRINFVQDGFVALQSHGHLHLFSAVDGRHLWSRTTEAVPGKDYVDERFVGHFYRHGLVWMLDQNSPRQPEGQNLWVALNPTDGAVVRELATHGQWPRTATPAKMGCQLLIASDRYIMIPRQATYIDIETGEKLPFKFVRGGCGLGFVPANGLVYSHPHACGCFSEAVRGFIGMHSMAAPEQRGAAEEPRLQTFATVQLAPEAVTDGDWPMHRGSGARGAAASMRIAGDIAPRRSLLIAAENASLSKTAWRLRTGNALTAPTVAGETAFLADTDQGRICAINLTTGETRWTFQASGRVDSSPTLYQGLCLFGAHDGYVYCLDAETGGLAWKFRAAPEDRRIVAFGHLESTWPVAGAILVHDGLVYAAAGRAPDADGGMAVHALEPRTGEPVWSTRVAGETFRGMCDFMIADADSVYLSNWKFDPRTGEHGPAPADSPHLQGGKVGLLEASWTKHDLALRKEIQTWTANGQEGQLLAFSPTHTAAYVAESRQLELRGGDTPIVVPVETPSQVTGLALTRDHLIVVGGKNRADCLAGGFLWTVELDSGRIIQELPLSAEAVLDGVSVGRDCILVATQDGQLHVFDAAVSAAF